MNYETISLLVDFLFAATGISLLVVQLVRRPRVLGIESAPSTCWTELALTAGGLAAAAIGPNILVVALTPGMPEMPVLARYALVPSLALLAVVWGI